MYSFLFSLAFLTHLAAVVGGGYLGYRFGRSVEAKAQAALAALKSK